MVDVSPSSTARVMCLRGVRVQVYWRPRSDCRCRCRRKVTVAVAVVVAVVVVTAQTLPWQGREMILYAASQAERVRAAIPPAGVEQV